MKLEISRDDLFEMLPLVCGVVERAPRMQVYSNVLLDLNESGELRITGGDSEMEAQCFKSLGEGSEFEAGQAAVSAAKLQSICSVLPGNSKIAVLQRDAKNEEGEKREELMLSCNRSQFSLSCEPGASFPLMAHDSPDQQISANPEDWGLQLSAGKLKQALDRVYLFMAQDDTRRYLQGMLWEIQQSTLVFVATDGRRLAICRLPLGEKQDEKQQNASEGQAQSTADSTQIIVPRKGIERLRDILSKLQAKEELKISIKGNALCLEGGPYVLKTKLIDERFPEYGKLLPETQQNPLSLDSGELSTVLARVATLAHERLQSVNLKVDAGSVEATSHNEAAEKAVDSISADYAGEAFEVVFNIKYLQDVSKAFDGGRVNISVSDPTASILFEHESASEGMETKCVVMPIRF